MYDIIVFFLLILFCLNRMYFEKATLSYLFTQRDYPWQVYQRKVNDEEFLSNPKKSSMESKHIMSVLLNSVWSIERSLPLKVIGPHRSAIAKEWHENHKLILQRPQHIRGTIVMYDRIESEIEFAYPLLYPSWIDKQHLVRFERIDMFMKDIILPDSFWGIHEIPKSWSKTNSNDSPQILLDFDSFIRLWPSLEFLDKRPENFKIIWTSPWTSYCLIHIQKWISTIKYHTILASCRWEKNIREFQIDPLQSLTSDLIDSENVGQTQILTSSISSLISEYVYVAVLEEKKDTESYGRVRILRIPTENHIEKRQEINSVELLIRVPLNANFVSIAHTWSCRIWLSDEGYCVFRDRHERMFAATPFQDRVDSQPYVLKPFSKMYPLDRKSFIGIDMDQKKVQKIVLGEGRSKWGKWWDEKVFRPEVTMKPVIVNDSFFDNIRSRIIDLYWSPDNWYLESIYGVVDRKLQEKDWIEFNTLKDEHERDREQEHEYDRERKSLSTANAYTTYIYRMDLHQTNGDQQTYIISLLLELRNIMPIIYLCTEVIEYIDEVQYWSGKYKN